MKDVIEKLADRLYNETDFGRSIATSLSGIIGLIAYLLTNDWVIAIFSLIIVFPIIRLLANSLYQKFKKYNDNQEKQKNDDDLYDKLTEEEKDIIQAFVNAGGCRFEWEDIEKFEINQTGLRTLIERELIDERPLSTELDYPVYEYILKTALYDIGNKKRSIYNQEEAEQRRAKRREEARLFEDQKKLKSRSRCTNPNDTKTFSDFSDFDDDIPF
ncbi:hypothetical protein [Candidatus Thiothrix anitrata]|uniref:Uncharacterized protein n=1 Tax=Candidatus Thiothrix anitrata TaxID=2823902 RepID=A0ABX7X6X2_9GAMM|nr:hypothetical protein [Candidatus Thiothrix anitrata]QTR48960.1 hypothetical protein J8380_11805 [Candidatus Thiothrix anitrata]